MERKPTVEEEFRLLSTIQTPRKHRAPLQQPRGHEAAPRVRGHPAYDRGQLEKVPTADELNPAEGRYVADLLAAVKVVRSAPVLGDEGAQLRIEGDPPGSQEGLTR